MGGVCDVEYFGNLGLVHFGLGNLGFGIFWGSWVQEFGPELGCHTAGELQKWLCCHGAGELQKWLCWGLPNWALQNWL